MAIENFKKTLWEAGLITEFRKSSVARLISTKPSDKQGNKIIFNRLTTSKPKDYNGSIDWDEINTTPVEMVFDKKIYWAKTMSDLDKVQLVKDLMKDVIADQAASVREQEDTDFFATIVADKGIQTLNKGGSPITITPANIYEKIVDMGTKLSKKKVSRSDRYVVVDAEILGLLSKDARFTRNPSVLENGIVEGQKINGLQVICCEELPENTIIALHKSAVGFDAQLEETEAMRLQNSFADGVRGLDVYGTKVLRPEAIVTLKYSVNPGDALEA